MTPLAVACGMRHLAANVAYTVTVLSAAVSSSPECQQLLAIGAVPTENGCLACPLLQPQVGKMVCCMFDTTS